MRRWWLPLSLAVMVLGIVAFLVRDFLRPKVAGLEVVAEPAASVYVDGNQVGVSPYSAKMKPGEVVVKLVPMTTTTALSPYEIKVRLYGGATTVVRRWFGPSEELSAGEVVGLERYEAKEKRSGALVVVSSPDAAAVRVNGVLKGFTPLVQDGVPAGEYQVAVGTSGWRERVVNVRVEARHRLNLAVKLAKEEGELLGGEEASGGASLRGEGRGVTLTPVPTEGVGKPYVEVKETPTGWLRVRAEASTGARELGRVSVGGRYRFVGKSGDWYKIEYDLGKQGWVSAQYAKLVE